MASSRYHAWRGVYQKAMYDWSSKDALKENKGHFGEIKTNAGVVSQFSEGGEKRDILVNL